MRRLADELSLTLSADADVDAWIGRAHLAGAKVVQISPRHETLEDMFLRLGNVGGTVNPQTRLAWASIQPSAWYEAIGAIPGLISFSVGTPSSAITPATGYLPILGAMTYNA